MTVGKDILEDDRDVLAFVCNAAKIGESIAKKNAKILDPGRACGYSKRGDEVSKYKEREREFNQEFHEMERGDGSRYIPKDSRVYVCGPSDPPPGFAVYPCKNANGWWSVAVTRNESPEGNLTSSVTEYGPYKTRGAALRFARGEYKNMAIQNEVTK